jgi:hypothetical protein
MPIAFNPHFKLKVIDLTDDTTVGPAGSNTQTLTPPAGKIYSIKYIYYNAPDPAGSGAGTHELAIERILVTSERRNALVKATTGNTINIGTNSLWAGDSAEYPSNANQQHDLMYRGDLICSNDYPIKFVYNNDTDVNQTGTRVLEILVKEYDEVR